MDLDVILGNGMWDLDSQLGEQDDSPRNPVQLDRAADFIVEPPLLSQIGRGLKNSYFLSNLRHVL